MQEMVQEHCFFHLVGTSMADLLGHHLVSAAVQKAMPHLVLNRVAQKALGVQLN